MDNDYSPLWWLTKDGDEYCMRLFRRHYSHSAYADGRVVKLFCGPGQKIVLRTWEANAMWVWRKFIDKSGQTGVNCAIFRNESRHQSSELVRQADAVADFAWPGLRHYTYVNAARVKSENPGFCFKKAGWKQCGETKSGLVILEKSGFEPAQSV